MKHLYHLGGGRKGGGREGGGGEKDGRREEGWEGVTEGGRMREVDILREGVGGRKKG